MASFRNLRVFAAAGVQTLALQALGIVFFYVLSLYTSKPVFGILGWCNAVAFLVVTTGSLGLEQVVLRRIAAGQGRSDWAAMAFFLHSLCVSLLALLVLGGMALVVPQSEKMRVLPLLFGAQALASLATPFRLLLNANRIFTPYSLVGLASNGVKLGAAVALGWAGKLQLWNAALVLTGGAAIELLGAVWLAGRLVGLQRVRRWRAYALLVREAAPQFVSVLFDTGLARLDWVLLGILASDSDVAEYSFAYRAFELERLPTVALGAVLLPLMARWAAQKGAAQDARQAPLRSLLPVVVALTGWMSVLAAAGWVPVVDAATHGVYGASSVSVVTLLNAALPAQYAVNLLWTQTFAAKRYRPIVRITALTALVNLAGNLCLIPIWRGSGAAAAFLISSLVQVFLYVRLAQRAGFAVPVRSLALLLVLAGGLLAAGWVLGWQDWRGVAAGLVVFPLLAAATGAARPADLRQTLSSLAP